MNHEAVFALYPQVVTVDDSAGAFDKDGNKVVIDLAAVNAWKNLDEHKGKRFRKYPPIGELADALYWASTGDTSKLDAYYAACAAVKAKYPKSS